MSLFSWTTQSFFFYGAPHFRFTKAVHVFSRSLWGNHMYASRLFVIFSLFSFISASSFASLLNLEPSGKTLENVPISKSAVATVGDRSFSLTTVGAGIRAKKVAVVNVKVYVTQLMLSDASHYIRTDAGALKSAAEVSSSAIRLDFLRSVDAQTVQLAFRDSLIANQVDLNDSGVKAFLNAVAAGGDAAQGKALTLVFEHLPSGKEAVTYEDNSGKTTTVTGEAGLIHNILSIWLGKTTDNGLANLKKSLIEGN
jgi:hypothetical protein